MASGCCVVRMSNLERLNWQEFKFEGEVARRTDWAPLPVASCRWPVACVQVKIDRCSRLLAAAVAARQRTESRWRIIETFERSFALAHRSTLPLCGCSTVRSDCSERLFDYSNAQRLECVCVCRRSIELRPHASTHTARAWRILYWCAWCDQ